MPIAIPGDGPLNVKRTLGSLVPHPAAIGKIAGAKMPKLHLAGGGIANAENIGANMFQPITSSGGIPNADVNFITSPQLSVGPGPRAIPSPQTEKQPSAAQEVSEGTQAANGITGMYNSASKGMSGILSGTGNNPSLIGSIQSGMAGNGFGGVLTGPNAQSSIGGISNGFAPGMSLDTLASGSGAATVPADMVGQAIGASATTDAAATLPIAADAALAATTDAAAADGGAAALEALMMFAASGGAINGYASGGEAQSLSNMLMRREAGETYHPGGLLNSAGPGRTDTINTNVPTGAYVIPADVVSGLGEGNTLAGSAVIDRMFSTAPYGVAQPKIRHGRGAPEGKVAPSINPDSGPSTVDTQFINSAGTYAKGGAPDNKAPVVVAGGEHVINPADIIKKFGSLKKGHAILDRWVLLQREKHINDLKKLDVPVGSGLKKKG